MRLARLSRQPGSPPLPELIDMARERERDPAHQKPRAGMARRQFLQASFFSGLAGLGLPLLGGGLSGCGEGATTARVAIVGAGLAGLHAAYLLGKAGVAADLYEASERTGGRMMTSRGLLAPDLYTDVGGEFIDTGHEVLRGLCSELGLSLIDAQAPGEEKLERETYYFEGAHRTDAQVVKAMEPLVGAIEADATKVFEAQDLAAVPEIVALDRLSISAYLDRIGARGFVRKLLEVAYVTEYGLDPGEQSCLNLITLISTDLGGGRLSIYGESDERYTVRGGAQAVTDALRAKLAPERLHLGHRLVALRPRPSGAGMGARLVFDRLGGGGATEVDADVVALCLPFSVLREASIEVELPQRKRQAIAELGYGQNAKLLCGFTSRVWRDKGRAGYVYTDEPFQGAWDCSRGQPGTAGGMTLFLGGKAGVDLGGGASMDRAAALLPGLDKALPGTKAAFNGKVGRFHWPGFSLSKGSYSCYKPGQWIGLRGAEGEAVGSLLFGGEHTSLDYQGYMEGAAESGARVAKEALALLMGGGK
jgi:monoamine oxidase